MMPQSVIITSMKQVDLLKAAAESQLDVELSEARNLLNRNGALVKVSEVEPHMRSACVIQDVLQVLNQITQASHSHPTIIPLTPAQSDMMEMLIDFAHDLADDEAMSPIYNRREQTLTATVIPLLCREMNEAIDDLVAATELRNTWRLSKSRASNSSV